MQPFVGDVGVMDSHSPPVDVAKKQVGCPRTCDTRCLHVTSANSVYDCQVEAGLHMHSTLICACQRTKRGSRGGKGRNKIKKVAYVFYGVT